MTNSISAVKCAFLLFILRGVRSCFKADGVIPCSPEEGLELHRRLTLEEGGYYSER